MVQHPTIIPACLTSSGLQRKTDTLRRHVARALHAGKARRSRSKSAIWPLSLVFGVNCCRPFPAQELFYRETCIIEPTLVEVVEVAVRPGGMDQRGNRVTRGTRRIKRILAVASLFFQCEWRIRIAAREIVPLVLGSSETRPFPITTLFAEPFGASELPVDNSSKTRRPHGPVPNYRCVWRISGRVSNDLLQPDHCELAIAHISQFRATGEFVYSGFRKQ